MEHWGNQNRKWVDKIDMSLKDEINCLFLNEDTETVFVGGNDNILQQFNLLNGEVLNEYSNTGVGNIISLSSFKHLLCVGGNNHFALIHMKTNEILTAQSIKTSVKQALTSQFCVVKINKEDKITLTVSGSNCLLKIHLSKLALNYLIIII